MAVVEDRTASEVGRLTEAMALTKVWSILERGFLAVACVGVFAIGQVGTSWAEDNAGPKVVELTLVPCQIVEPEKVDHGYKAESRAECEAINEQTWAHRSKASRLLTLAPGKYLFRVTNKKVPYPAGFWIRQADFDWRYFLDRFLKFNMLDEGFPMGETREYEFDLKIGKYLYSSPQNPTLDYHLEVTEHGGRDSAVTW